MNGRFSMAVPAGRRPLLPPMPGLPEPAVRPDPEEVFELVDLTPKQSWLSALFR